MNLTRHATPQGPRWAADGYWLEAGFDLRALLALPAAEMSRALRQAQTGQPAGGDLLAPIEDTQEIWASGVTYLRSREARQAESSVASVYDRVYSAERPELFFKASGWRVAGPGQAVRIRADSAWNVPEPELTLVINCHAEIVGYTAGNDMSSRSIEGENPLYLPQAKIYNGACALGPALRLLETDALQDLPVEISIERGGQSVFSGATRTSNMNRGLQGLADYLFRELAFPQGAFLLTGTGIVPPESFSLAQGDVISVGVGGLSLRNPVGA